MQDNIIIKALQKDPNQGLKLLMERYAGLVYSIITGKMFIPPFTAEDIEDCVSDTFLEFYHGLSKYDPTKGSIKAWLCIYLINTCLMHQVISLRTYATPQ